MARKVEIQFIGDESDLSRATRSATGDLEHFSKRAGVIGGIVGAATTAVFNAAASGARALVGFTKDAIAEAEEAQRIGKVTATLVKSTGGAANISAKQIANLTEHLSNLSGIDDEVIQAGTNVMLTFRNVRNEAGKGNDIFNRSQAAALDLSAVLGTDLTSANLQLGKALNDPVKGMTALRRSGISFTQQQIDQVKAMVKSNDILGAQRLILDEVQKEVGGAAEANATATQRMSTAWKNFQEDIGTIILPAFEAFVSWFSETALPAIESFVSRSIDVLKGWGETIGNAIAGALQIAQPYLDALGQWVRDNAEPLKTAGVAVATFAAAFATLKGVESGVSAVKSFGASLAQLLPLLASNPYLLAAAAIIAVGVALFYAYTHVKPVHDAFNNIADAVSKAVDWFERLGTAAKVGVAIAAAAFAPLLLTIGAVVLAVRHWDEIVATAKRVFDNVRNAVVTAIAVIAPYVQAAFAVISTVITTVGEFFVSAWQRYGDEITGILVALGELFAAVFNRIAQLVNILVTVLTTAASIILAVLAPVFDQIAGAWQIAFNVIVTIVKVFVDLVQQIWALWGDEILATVRIVWNLIANIIEGALRVIQGIIQVVTGLISGDWSKAWEGLRNIASGVWQQIAGIAQSIINFFKTTWSALTSLITAPFDKARDAVHDALDGIANTIKDIFSTIKRVADDIVGAVQKIIDTVKKIPGGGILSHIPGLSSLSAPAPPTVGVVPAGAFTYARTAPSLLGARVGATPAAAVQTIGATSFGRPIVINMPEGTDGTNVVNAIVRYTRRNGVSAWRR